MDLPSDGLANRSDESELTNWLLEDFDWILRRVEQVEIVDLNHLKRRISVDIDTEEVWRRQERLWNRRDDHALLPLASMPRTLLLDFSISCSDAGQLHLPDSLERRELVRIALESSVVRWSSESGLSEDTLRQLIDQTFDGSPFRDPTEDDSSELTYHPDGGITLPAYLRSPLVEDSMKLPEFEPAWEKLLMATDFAERMREAHLHSILAVHLSLPGTILTVKYEWTEFHKGLQSPELNLAAVASPAAARYIDIPLRDAGKARKSHLRVSAPDGTELGRSLLIFRPPGATRLRLKFWQRETPTESIFYLDRLAPMGRYFYMCTLWPRIAGFFLPAITLTLLGALAASIALLFAFWGDGHFYMSGIVPRFDTGETSGFRNLAERVRGVPSMLALFASVMVALLIRDQEHAARERLLRRYRKAAFFTMVPLFLAVVGTTILSKGSSTKVVYWRENVLLALWTFCLMTCLGAALMIYRARTNAVRAHNLVEAAGQHTTVKELILDSEQTRADDLM